VVARAARHIVIVEDELDVLELLQDLLTSEGFTVTGVGQPSRLERVNLTVPPDLFLIDVMLPGISGIELAERLRQQGFGGTPIIGMSASRLMTKMASESGFFVDVLNKPFEVADLLARIGRYAGERQTRS
jgi:CheY-like chemotaxis protein